MYMDGWANIIHPYVWWHCCFGLCPKRRKGGMGMAGAVSKAAIIFYIRRRF
jgi:hypothetical protein